MDEWQGWPKLQFESELDPGFADEIASIPGGDKLFSCIQCGTCSGMCPLSPCMDYTPRQIVAMIRAGFKSKVLTSVTTWLCASCYICTVECPIEIKLTDIMYAVKRRAIEEKVYPKRFPIPVLASMFFKGVERSGRNTESWLSVWLFLKTNPLQLFKQAALGLRLMLRGRLSPKRESVKRKKELRTILKAMEKDSTAKGNRELALTEKGVS